MADSEGAHGPRRVVIIGGGFGGLFAARALRRAPVSVTLVDRAHHHLFQPLLYQCATGILSEGQIAAPLRSVLKGHKNVECVMAEVSRHRYRRPPRDRRSGPGAVRSNSGTTTSSSPPGCGSPTSGMTSSPSSHRA